MKIEIISTEEIIYSDEVDIVVAPGSEGQLGILPSHAPLITSVKQGDVVVRNHNKEETIAISGGFLEVLNDKVTILTDSQ